MNRHRVMQDQAIEWLARLRATDVTDVEKADFAQWLADDIAHKQAFDETLDLWEHVGERMADSSAIDPPDRRWVPLAVAASLLMLATAMFLFNPAGIDYATAVGEQRRVALSDGSSMHLNTSTTTDVKFDDSRRLITLERGEAYFQVAKDASRPFEVHTPHGVARAIGTAFAVHTTPGLTQVVVTEGTVEFSADDRTLHLQAGASAAASAQSLQLTDVDVDSAIGWTSGRLVYDHVSLEYVINDLNRYFPARMALTDAAGEQTLSETRVTTLIYLSDQEAVLDGLSAAFNLKWSRVNENLILISHDG